MKKEFLVICMMSGGMSVIMGHVWCQEHRARYSHFFPLMNENTFCSEMSRFSLKRQQIVLWSGTDLFPLLDLLLLTFSLQITYKASLLREEAAGKKNEKCKFSPEGNTWKQSGGRNERNWENSVGDTCYCAVCSTEQFRGSLYIYMVLNSTL